MSFVDTNSHLKTKLHNFDIKCQSNSESYDRHSYFGIKFRGWSDFFIYGGRFSQQEGECSGADWLDPLLRHFS